MNIIEFAQEHRTKAKGKIKSAIAERWNTRVIPQGLDRLGKQGASAYLDAYGKGVAAPKVIELDICAEVMQATDMAAGFWEAAYCLATGNRETNTAGTNADANVRVVGQPAALGAAYGTGMTPVIAPTAGSKNPAPNMPEFPPQLQPGRIQTMQPVDAPDGQANYIHDPNYVGQPKRDGHRNVMFGTPSVSYHQSRSTSGLGQICPEMEEAVKLAAGDTGAFIIDGERYYRSVTGSEHRTAAQCATANAEAGQPTVLPVPVFAAFEALFANGRDLTNQGKLARIEAASGIVAIIHSYLPADARCAIEHLTPAISTTEKRNLARSQGEEGREGEVWTHRDAPYNGGKKHGHSFRTKYLQEDFFYIVGVNYSTASGRTVKSFELADANGKPVGSVGTGFDESTGVKLAKEFEAGGKPKVEIKFQNFTESGILWHSRMI